MGDAARSGLIRRNLRSLEVAVWSRLLTFKLINTFASRAAGAPPGAFLLGHLGRDLVSNFAQTASAKGVHTRMSGHTGRVLMSETDQFWQYAREAMLSACGAKTGEDKQDLLELAGVWTQAALHSRSRPARSGNRAVRGSRRGGAKAHTQPLREAPSYC